MKNFLIILLLLCVNISFSQHIKRNVYELHECVYNQKGELLCDKEEVDYEIIINTDLSFIFLLDKKNQNKLFGMDIINYNKVDNDLWLYELRSEKDTKYHMSYDIKRQTIILFPIHGLNARNIKLSSIILRFRNPITL